MPIFDIRLSEADLALLGTQNQMEAENRLEEIARKAILQWPGDAEDNTKANTGNEGNNRHLDIKQCYSAKSRKPPNPVHKV